MASTHTRHALGAFEDDPYDFAPDERSPIAGSPARPNQAPSRRALYLVVAVLLCFTSGLGSALISVNASYLMGPLHADSDQIAWVPVAYVMTYVSMNLLLVRFRQQFGLRRYTMVALIGFCCVTALHIVVTGLPGAIMIHAAAGMAGAPLGALAVYYMMAAWPTTKALNALVLALGLLQIATPLAGTFSSSSIAIDDLRTLYMFELGMAFLCLGSVALLRLPPSQKIDVLEPLDFVTFVLFSGGAACVCAVVGLGASVWWLDRAWLGWTLAAAVPLLGSALYIELNRARPLLDLQWLTTPILVRFAVIALSARFLISEQSSVTSLLSMLGVSNEELHFYYGLELLAGVAGAVLGALLFKPQRIGLMVGAALAMVAIAAFSDSHATDLSRAPEFYISQMMITFALSFFFGPALLFGIVQVMKRGQGVLPSLLVVFIGTQLFGSLLGSAVFSTYQTIREKYDSAQLVQWVQPFEATTTRKVAEFSESLYGLPLNAGARAGGGVALLQKEQTFQANILAYDNTFMLASAMAGMVIVFMTVVVTTHRARASREG